MPRRPVHSMRSIIANLLLLTGVPSFRRWPLTLNFFAQEAFATWKDRLKNSTDQVRPDIDILTDFAKPSEHVNTNEAIGIHSMPLNYRPMGQYVEKTHDIVKFEQEGSCVHCTKELESGKGLHAMCPNEGCTAMGHLDCWAKHALSADEEEHIIPALTTCPSCKSDIRWGTMVKELTLRTRGQADVQKLLKYVRKEREAVLEG